MRCGSLLICISLQTFRLFRFYHIYSYLFDVCFRAPSGSSLSSQEEPKSVPPPLLQQQSSVASSMNGPAAVDMNGELLSQLRLEMMGEIRREIAKAKQEIIDGKIILVIGREDKYILNVWPSLSAKPDICVHAVFRPCMTNEHMVGYQEFVPDILFKFWRSLLSVTVTEIVFKTCAFCFVHFYYTYNRPGSMVL